MTNSTTCAKKHKFSRNSSFRLESISNGQMRSAKSPSSPEKRQSVSPPLFPFCPFLFIELLFVFVEIATGAYERICVLYSLGALYSACASTQNLTDDKGLQTAVKYFRQAAGIFNFLRINAPATLQQEATSDLNPDVLHALSALMLAQAQDCVYMKVFMGECRLNALVLHRFHV